MKVSYIVWHFPLLKIQLFQLGLNFDMILELRMNFISKIKQVRSTD